MSAETSLTRRRLLAGAAAAALAGPGARAQGFAGMGAEAAEFAQVVPGAALDFPRDHLAHPGFRIEWWYVTANLRAADGTRLGVQWTLFRTAFEPGDTDLGAGWDSPQLWFAHAAITTAETHRAEERFARGGIGQAGVTAPPFRAWIDDWALEGAPGPGDLYDRLSMRARGASFAFALDMAAEGPLVLHGEEGFSLKSERGQASYYYSQPFYRVRGSVTLDGEETQVEGRAWLDREWSSQPLDETQTGWDWFSLSFDDGDKAMLYRIRQADGDTFSGTWIGADGATAQIARADIAFTPLDWADVAGRETPVRWRVEIAGRGVEIEVAALNPRAWNALTVSYWEGPVIMTGTHPGEGYLEMTGY
ncbi:MAG: lipocalin-like domain-containing protein [Rubrimonas sp.]|uniref:lipocalin-like domain-containing protein n=1 Tax=Rubrimonas sp. TaxID=2036015 RepID=UPI002FDC9C20